MYTSKWKRDFEAGRNVGGSRWKGCATSVNFRKPADAVRASELQNFHL